MPELPPWVQILKAQGVPEPQREYVFAPPRKWRADYCWPQAELRLVLEIEGGVWKRGGGRHNRAKGFIGDMAKYNALAIMGFRLIRATPQQVASGEVVDLVLKAMGKDVK